MYAKMNKEVKQDILFLALTTALKKTPNTIQLYSPIEKWDNLLLHLESNINMFLTSGEGLMTQSIWLIYSLPLTGSHFLNCV